jgi:hypothetical protein
MIVVGFAGRSREDGNKDGLALYRSESGVGDAAVLNGELVREGGCTYVVGDHGNRWLPLFPKDTAWDDDVLVVGGDRYPTGERSV